MNCGYVEIEEFTLAEWFLSAPGAITQTLSDWRANQVIAKVTLIDDSGAQGRGVDLYSSVSGRSQWTTVNGCVCMSMYSKNGEDVWIDCTGVFTMPMQGNMC